MTGISKSICAVPDSCRTGVYFGYEFCDSKHEFRPIHASLDAPDIVPVGSTRRQDEWENQCGSGYFEYGCVFRERMGK